MEEIKEKNLVGYPNTISYQCTKKIINQMENCICKFSIGNNQGTGFFCQIPFSNYKNKLSVFITNNHLIDEEALNTNDQKINLNIRGENNLKILNLNGRLKHTYEEYDTTIIEIKEKDQINNYLELDEFIINDIQNGINRNFDYQQKTIYTIQYPDGELSVSYGVLSKIPENNPFTFHHLCSTKYGSSGSPILNINNQVIGIHRASSQNNYNLGTFLNYPIKEFIKLYDKYKDSNIYTSIDKETECDSIINYDIADNNKYKKVISLNEFKDSVNAVLILSDNRLCACSSDCSIKVFDIQNSNFDLKINNIKAHSDKIWCIEEIKKNVLASGGKNDIKIWLISDNYLELINSIKLAHNDYLNKIIKLDNNEFASCSRDGKVKIWSENYSEKYCINAHNSYINSILKLNNGLLVSGSNGEGSLKFWNLKDLSLYKAFNDIYSTAYNNCLLEVDNILFVGEKSGIGIYSLEKNNIKPYFYKDEKLKRILSICYIGNNIIASGSTNGNIFLFKIIKKKNLTLENINIIKNNLNLKKEEFNFAISGITYYNQYNKSFILYCSIDGSIKMYELNKTEFS